MYYGFSDNVNISLLGKADVVAPEWWLLLQVTAFAGEMFSIQLFSDVFQFEHSPRSPTYKELLLNKHTLRTSTNL